MGKGALGDADAERGEGETGPAVQLRAVDRSAPLRRDEGGVSRGGKNRAELLPQRVSHTYLPRPQLGAHSQEPGTPRPARAGAEDAPGGGTGWGRAGVRWAEGGGRSEGTFARPLPLEPRLA